MTNTWLILKSICYKQLLYGRFISKKRRININPFTKTGLINLTKLQKYIGMKYFGNKDWFTILKAISRGSKSNGF